MAGFTQFGDQNPIGTTYDVDPDRYQERVGEYKEAAEETENGLVPPDSDVYVGAMRFNWDGLPTVLEAGREYDIHLGAYDVQHGFSVRPEENLNKQINLQVFPGSEWVIPMTFDEPGTYRRLQRVLRTGPPNDARPLHGGGGIACRRSPPCSGTITTRRASGRVL